VSISRALLWLVVLALAACSSPRESAPPASTAATPPAVTRRPLPETAPPQGAASTPAGTAPTAAASMPPIAVPPGAIYVCVTGPAAAPAQTAIEYAEKVDALCRKHPEMGPCQYERNACRKKGGRVFAADGSEITLATEAEYDKKVRRVTFKAN
jgi:hypothetical protein